jgi:hypothetical protein
MSLLRASLELYSLVKPAVTASKSAASPLGKPSRPGSLLPLTSSIQVGRPHVIATDPAAPLDLSAWCHMTGHEYLGPVADHKRDVNALRLAAESTPTRPDPMHPGTGPNPAPDV